LSWTSRRAIPVLLAAATLVPIGALGWLGLRILQQDREMERQHRRESLEYAAGRAVLAVEGRLAAIEEQLAQGRGGRLTVAGLDVTDGPAVLFQPEQARVNAPENDRPGGLSHAAFAAAEALEFQRKDAPGAVMEYRRLAESRDPAVRAGALVRLGRMLRNTGAPEEALRTYGRLQQLGPLQVDGQPAEIRTLLLIPTGGGEPREVMSVSSEVEPAELRNNAKGQSVGGVTWGMDSRSFLTKRFGEGRKDQEVWQVPVDGGAPRKLDGTVARNIGRIRLHPDGRQIAFIVTDPGPQPTEEVWVLENFLPTASAKKCQGQEACPTRPDAIERSRPARSDPSGDPQL